MGKIAILPLIAARLIPGTVLVFMICYCIKGWHEARKVTALNLAAGVSGCTLGIQVIFILVNYLLSTKTATYCALAVDLLGAVAWIATLAVLSYCATQEIYKPESGAPQEWHACADANAWSEWYDAGYARQRSRDPEILWCRFNVYGSLRWVANEGARRQLHMFIGFTAAALVLALLIVMFSLLLRYENSEERARDVQSMRSRNVAWP